MFAVYYIVGLVSDAFLLILVSNAGSINPFINKDGSSNTINIQFSHFAENTFGLTILSCMRIVATLPLICRFAQRKVRRIYVVCMYFSCSSLVRINRICNIYM